MFIVTGGAGFIGSNFVIKLVENKKNKIINIDKLTYAGNYQNIKSLEKRRNYKFFKANIGDKKIISNILKKNKPRYIINFAAETHVDRSIINPQKFFSSNVYHSFNFFNEVYNYWKNLDSGSKKKFRFLHVSTDEVYGSLGKNQKPFTENSLLKPNNPYSSSKAAFDQLIRSYSKTFDMPILITRCSNNYGPRQNSEKLIPLCIKKLIKKKNIPIYGNGMQIRDWLHVSDHCSAIYKVLKKGKVGEIYNIGGNNEKRNLDLVKKICKIFDQKNHIKNFTHLSLIQHITDRLGHDTRYSINNTKIKRQLGWSPKIKFENGISNTIDWYLKTYNWK
tara:strand:- start:792 stop:1793 length:1002 start_codon:yes stop_codon:yes gene_type:complete